MAVQATTSSLEREVGEIRGIFEILSIDNAIRDLIDRSEDFLKIKEMAIKRGMRTLRQSALRKLAEGTTSFEEVIRVTGI